MVTGRAAAALVRRERVKKDKKVKVKKVVKPTKDPLPKRGPGRPRKEATTPTPAKRLVRRRRPSPSRSGVIS